jgi:hypothetical protein
VQVTQQTPFSNGNCHVESAIVNFIVFCKTEGPSSKACSDLTHLVRKAMHGKHLYYTGIIPETTIDVQPEVAPFQESDKQWVSEVQCITKLKETNV